jgi:hypothetical protein
MLTWCVSASHDARLGRETASKLINHVHGTRSSLLGPEYLALDRAFASLPLRPRCRRYNADTTATTNDNVTIRNQPIVQMHRTFREVRYDTFVDSRGCRCCGRTTAASTGSRTLWGRQPHAPAIWPPTLAKWSAARSRWGRSARTRVRSLRLPNLCSAPKVLDARRQRLLGWQGGFGYQLFRSVVVPRVGRQSPIHDRISGNPLPVLSSLTGPRFQFPCVRRNPMRTIPSPTSWITLGTSNSVTSPINSVNPGASEGNTAARAAPSSTTDRVNK